MANLLPPPPTAAVASNQGSPQGGIRRVTWKGDSVGGDQDVELLGSNSFYVGDSKTSNTNLRHYSEIPTIIDTGCNITIIADIKLMQKLTPHELNIGTANSDAPPLLSSAYGPATIIIGDSTSTIPAAYYCKNAPLNLIATNDLEAIGMYFVSVNGQPGKIFKYTSKSPSLSDNLVATCTKRFGLHYLPTDSKKISTSDLALLSNRYFKLFPTTYTNNDDTNATCLITAKLLHDRLGHASYQRLRHAMKNSTTFDMPQSRIPSNAPPCETCVKSTRKTSKFNKTSIPRNQPPGEMLHMDVVELKPLFHGFRYLLVIVDDTSRFTWSVKLKTKDKAMEEAIGVIERIRVHHGRNVKVLRFDRGELHSTLFKEYTTQNHISCEMSPRKTPQMDGTAERHIQTLVNIIHSLLTHSNMSTSCWGHAVDMALYIKNALPIPSRQITSPFEAFIGLPPRIAHLRTFGCKVLYHLHKTDRKKLDARALEAIYIGPATRIVSASYSIVHLIDRTGKVIERRFEDCVFYENEFPPVPYVKTLTTSLDMIFDEGSISESPIEKEVNEVIEVIFISPKKHPLSHPHANFFFFFGCCCCAPPMTVTAVVLFVFIPTGSSIGWLMWEWGKGGMQICTKYTRWPKAN